VDGVSGLGIPFVLVHSSGKVIDETNLNMDGEEDEYTFCTSWPIDKVLGWNLGAELLEDASANVTTERLKRLLLP
jgi:[histone H3]-lysine9 N-dimethyltransferase